MGQKFLYTFFGCAGQENHFLGQFFMQEIIFRVDGLYPSLSTHILNMFLSMLLRTVIVRKEGEPS